MKTFQSKLFIVPAAFLLVACQIPNDSLARAAASTTPANAGNSETKDALVVGTTNTTNEAVGSIPVRAITPPRLKKIVAVSRFENRAGINGGGQYALDDGMADQLSDALVQSGCFTVLERQTLGDVVDEQKLANSGLATKSQSAQSGKLVNAQILIKGTITEFEANCGSSGHSVTIPIPWGGGMGGGVSLGNKRNEAHVGLIVKLIDTTTGEILESQRVAVTNTSGSIGIGVESSVASFKSDSFKTTSLGKATQMAIDDAVFRITTRLKDVPFQARVIKINGEDELLISGGARTGISEGDAFTLYSVGESLVDPSTGEQLGTELAKKGLVKVTHCEEKYAKAASEKPLIGIKVGDIVKIQ